MIIMCKRRADNGSPATGIILTGIPQLPVTTLNSVVAVCQLSADLFPARPAQPVLVSVSVGLMNMVGAWCGAMPCCHGAGGLAAQVKSAMSWVTVLQRDLQGCKQAKLRHFCLSVHSYRQQNCQSTHKALLCKAPDIRTLLSPTGEARGAHKGCQMVLGLVKLVLGLLLSSMLACAWP